ncbi:MAG: heavy metal-binding domain-containing protein [Candidatus Altiarchaeota archaeon]
MIVTTTDTISGYELEIMKVVFGNTVRAKNLVEDITAFLKNIVGGELQEYTEMLTDARRESMNRMVNAAQELKADAIVNVRFTTATAVAGAAELLAYGTAVKLKKK